MNGKKYPRIGSRRSTYPKNRCAICGGLKANMSIEVEWTQFRGDDDVHRVHKKCVKNMKSGELLRRLVPDEFINH